MKTKNIILIILTALLAAETGWIFLRDRPNNPVVVHKHKDLYFCPMHPQITSDKPGICPICQMKLVKKKNDSEAQREEHMAQSDKSDWTLNPPGYAAVAINAEQQQLMGVRTTTVTKKTLTKTIHAYGYVAHDLELYDMQLEYIDAWRVYYAYLSRRPIADQFRTDWREYYIKEPTQGRWRSDEKVKALQRLVKAEYELRHMGLTDAQLEQLRKIEYGQPWVQPDLLFFEKDQPFWIYAQILEHDLGFIAPGQKVIATIPVYKETTEGIVKSVAAFVDPATRTSRVRIELPAYHSELSVNMYVDIDMPVELADSLVIPRSAIMDTGLNKIVFVRVKDGVFEPRDIETGFEGDGMVAVKSGLKEGEVIVASGNFLLDSESRLQGALAGGQEP